MTIKMRWWLINSIGNFQYAKTFGEQAPGVKMDFDSTFTLASCTKLMTSIAALQCVEQELIALDDNLSNIVTELKDLKILTGFDENGAAILQPPQTSITLR